MKKFILLLFLFTYVLNLVSLNAMPETDSNTAPNSYERKLKMGIEAFYKTNWKQAASIFQELQKQQPDDARGYFFESMIPFWKYYFGGNAVQAAERFLNQSQKAIQIGKTQLAQNPHDTTTVLMLSGLYGYRSLVAASEKRYKTAIQSGMTGFTYTRQLLSLDAKDPKALIGKGVFYYMTGSVPYGLQWVTNMAGMSGDKKEGFKALEQAAQADSYVSNDAKMILAYLYEREGMHQKALANLKELTLRYPENIIFQYNQARLLEKCAQPTQARQKYQLVLTMDVKELQSLKTQSRNRLKQL